MAKAKSNIPNSKTASKAMKAGSKVNHEGVSKTIRGGYSLNENKRVIHTRKKHGGSVLNDNAMREPNPQYVVNYQPAVKHVRNTPGKFSGDIIYSTPVSEKITMIKNGISKKELETIKEQSNLDYETLSSILSVSKAKLHGKKGADKFDQNTSERIMLLADVLAYGQSVFEDKDTFNEWLKTTNTALGNKAPVDLMDTMYGVDEVKKEIGRIEYGVF